jgi:hypothetical protein
MPILHSFLTLACTLSLPRTVAVSRRAWDSRVERGFHGFRFRTACHARDELAHSRMGSWKRESCAQGNKVEEAKKNRPEVRPEDVRMVQEKHERLDTDAAPGKGKAERQYLNSYEDPFGVEPSREECARRLTREAGFAYQRFPAERRRFTLYEDVTLEPCNESAHHLPWPLPRRAVEGKSRGRAVPWGRAIRHRG